jgi:hypothetical protein
MLVNMQPLFPMVSATLRMLQEMKERGGQRIARK